MDYIIPFIVGWCGILIYVIGRPKGGASGGDPDNPWGDGKCIICGGLAGGILAVILETILKPQIGDAGLGARMAFDLAAGVVGVSLTATLQGFVVRAR
jgi:hypothetical protein